jgi:hypothetical protein
MSETNDRSVAAASNPDPIRDKAIRLFRYLGALAELRAKKVPDVQSYEAVFWFSELPCEKECYTPAWDGGEGTDEDNWLRIDKPVKPPPPWPPTECEHWFDPSRLDDVSSEPKLYEEIVDPKWIPGDGQNGDESDSTPPPRLLLSDHPHVASAWGKYLETKWRPWTAPCRRWERVQKAYRKLFAIYQEQQRRGEQYELLLGVGVLLWTTASDDKVRRPIVTARVTIALERQSGCITIAPAVDGANFAVEQDMLEVNERPPIQGQQKTEREVSALESPWDRGVITPILKSWIQDLPSAADAVYHDTLECPDRATRTPQMAFAPILILRKRGAQTMREVLKKIGKGLSDGKCIPRGVRGLCDLNDGAGEQRDGHGGAGVIPDEILFPLPTNDEQLEIVRRLHGHSGVLVQGPPGTGKSHTIVNLVSHLLASGKRVLVTSQTPRALKVLRDKIAEELPDILPLTVSLLGEDAESRDNLEHSVREILRHVKATSSTDAQRQIDATMQERKSLQSRLATLGRRQREVREANTTVYTVPGTPYQGTAQAIAQAVSRDANQFSWFTDRADENAAPPLTETELKELYSLSGECHRTAAAYCLPDSDSLPSPDEFCRAAAACSQATLEVERLGDFPGSIYSRRSRDLDRREFQRLSEIALQFVEFSEKLTARAKTDPWIDLVQSEICAGRTLPWTSLEATTSKALESLSGLSADDSNAELTIPAGVSAAQLLSDAGDLVRHLESRHGLGFWIFRAQVVKRCAYLWRNVRYRGRRCDSPATLHSLIARLKAKETLDCAWRECAQHLDRVRLHSRRPREHGRREWTQQLDAPGGTVHHRAVCLEQFRNVLRDILKLNDLSAETTNLIGAKGAQPGDDSDWGMSLLHCVKLGTACLGLKDAQAELSAMVETVRASGKSANPSDALNGLVAAAEKADVDAYREAFARLASLYKERWSAIKVLALDKKLRQQAPNLADAINAPDTRPGLAVRLDSFGMAWAWKRASAWLERFLAEHLPGVADEITQTERRLQEKTQTLVALKAWKSCRESLANNPMQEGALKAWQKIVKKGGKWTGKLAETDRRDARKYMQQCRSAIPAWIMPLYRVAEQVEPEPEIFDVVIVDEASQTGPEGLILQYLGKQCVVVGDEKQISPEVGFIDGGQVRALMEQHLDGIPFWETLNPAFSLFAQADVRYGNRIMLREHFRCMPEIIRFSNDLCYKDTPLIPLRQYPPSRLPPIQVRFVVDGYREGKSKSQDAINRPEAAAVAKTVIECLNDPRYSGKSFGVICLQGHAQAELIQNMILDKIGPQPFKDEKTRMLCGDPYSFQGDEREIVFLSMVAAVEGQVGLRAMTGDRFEQRFNVAASRARDQMWLFHSVRESDLDNPTCMRRQLLHFCYNPNASNTSSWDPERCDSDFERDVGEALLRAGFRVIPQYEFAGKRIDLVVEDRERRLAVECDGDPWHGPDEYEADMARQRMLERSGGWKFIRIRGCVFYANQPKAVKDLIDAIRAHGIEPHVVATDEAVPRDWVEEISGNRCMEALGAHTVDTAEENIVQQGELFPEESAEATTAAPPVQPAPWSAPSTAKPVAHPSAPPERPSGAPAPKPPMNSPASAAGTSRPPTSVSKPMVTSVTMEERKAIDATFDKYGDHLVEWKFETDKKSPLDRQLRQPRVHEVLLALVQEGTVKREEAADAVRYSRA